MIRESRTPEMNVLIGSIEARTRQIAHDGRQLGKARSVEEMAELSRRIDHGIKQLAEDGSKLRQMKRELSEGRNSVD